MNEETVGAESDGTGQAPLTGIGRLLVWVPAVLYMAALTYVSSQSTVPSLRNVPFQDKLLHFVAYTGLGFLVAFAAKRSWGKARAAVLLLAGTCIAAAFGVVDELHQSFVPGRHMSAGDALADLIGAFTGCALYLLTHGAISRLRRKAADST